MGNLLRVGGVSSGVMATKNRDSGHLGMDHPTVVPTNFEPPESTSETDDEELDGEEDGA
jgi:hypothetical protein